MISRRTFLAGSAVVAAGGTFAVLEVGRRRLLHRLGLVESPDRHAPVSGWPVVEHTLTSAAMKRNVLWAVAVPPTGATSVVICLHGRNDDHRFAFDEIHLHDVVAELGYPIAIVSVDGGVDSYWHPRGDGTDALAMVTNELLPAVDAALGVPVPRAVLGWSMGGYGALLVAEQSPRLFAASVAASPALWDTFDNATTGAFDSEADFARFDVFAGVASLATVAVRVDCGTDDGFVTRARALAASLPRPNTGRFSEGFHDGAYWRSIAADQINTISSAFLAG